MVLSIGLAPKMHSIDIYILARVASQQMHPNNSEKRLTVKACPAIFRWLESGTSTFITKCHHHQKDSQLWSCKDAPTSLWITLELIYFLLDQRKIEIHILQRQEEKSFLNPKPRIGKGWANQLNSVRNQNLNQLWMSLLWCLVLIWSTDHLILWPDPLIISSYDQINWL